MALPGEPPLRVTAAVNEDVVLERDRAGEIQVAVALDDDASAIDGVLLHDGELLG
jgi:hypothetical protein